MTRKLLYDLKTIRRYFLLMAVVCFVVLPLLNWYQMYGYPIQDTIGRVLAQAQLVLPLAAALPVAMLSREDLEYGSEEAIHACPVVFRNGARTILLIELICLLLIIPPFIWYSILCRMFLWPELLRTLIQCFFLHNLAVVLVYLTGFSLAGLGGQILCVGLMQIPLLSEIEPNAISETVNIYDRITVAQPRPFHPFRIVCVLIVAIMLWRIANNRMRHFMG